jgi:SNF2 family DNA or RNA helicase
MTDAMQGLENGAPEDDSRSFATLEQVTRAARIHGILPTQAVTVVAIEWHGSNAINVTYRDDGGSLGEALLYRDHEPSLRIETAAAAYAFDADPHLFKLVSEALRIRMAAYFDPMLAVNTSDIDPLPHQIKAVYGELLPRTPLRFLLADDPGAGKTIMAGLYIKELMLRGDLARCLVVAPGALVEQWQDELYEKFGLRFELLTRTLIDATLGGNVFEHHPLLIARMDQLSRNEELQTALEQVDYDLVVVDEAHRMSAHYFGSELKKTKRYGTGELLGRVARHLLLMTATPHAGDEASFQLFMALLDADRFEGRFRDGVHAVDTSGLMRRMVKEELLTFDGKPLFPERVAETLQYGLSSAERDLYEAVTDYVREQMSHADRLRQKGQTQRGNTVGFALTVLQRRLASSPEAIYRSLERRRKRLEKTKHELQTGGERGSPLEARLAHLLGRDNISDDEADDLTGAELEELEERVVDAASASETIADLDKEIAIVADLEELARRVRFAGTDRKWTELSSLLQEDKAMYEADGTRRKIIVFTEQRDTLNYLLDQIRALIGRDDAVVAIHGGVGREARRAAQALFTGDKDVHVLVATDAAGEGLNLQRAHLMVNYDLPWNPNRIEQRFGRIHRIGQTEVCRLWNLVASDTREGAVFHRLLDKIEEQRRAYEGKVFDVLGEAFTDRSLREILIDAIRYGDQPEVKARLNRVIDAEVADGLGRLIAERALHHDMLRDADVEQLRLQMEEARARRLQPHYVQDFFGEAFRLLGGRVVKREPDRYELTYVPQVVRDRDRQIGTGAPVLRRYERVCFDRQHTRLTGKPLAAMIAPGHPVLDSVVDLIIERYRSLLKGGALLVDANDTDEEPRLLVALTHEITDGHQSPRTISKRFQYVEIAPDGQARGAGPAPYLDYRVPTPEERTIIEPLRTEAWLASGIEQVARRWAIDHVAGDHTEAVTARVRATVERIRTQVRNRLLTEINYWDARHGEMLDAQAAGRHLRMTPERAERRARDLEHRLETRMRSLDADEALRTLPPVIAGGALVVPAGWIQRSTGQRDADPATHAKETAEVDRRAIAAVMAAERALGREPVEMPHNNPGYDIRSRANDGHWVFIEVKGRILGADTFSVTRNEVLTAKNAERYRLSLVRVHPEGSQADELRYVLDPFQGFEFGDFSADGVVGDWDEMWNKGVGPR